MIIQLITGGCFYISNINSKGIIKISFNQFLNNKAVENNIGIGSIINLNDPGSIFIENSLFQNNCGFLGTCIYYSESRDDYLIVLNNNKFISNNAKFGTLLYFFWHIDICLRIKTDYITKK